MNKTDFKKYINAQISGRTPEKQLDEIDKIIEYAKEYKEIIRARIEKRYTYCVACEKYYRTKSYKYTEADVKTTICVYTDCGYGDNDEYAPAIYHIKYRICPKCGDRREIESKMTWRGKSHTRYGDPGVF